MLNKLKAKMRSDTGAVGTTETILLIAVSVFAVMIIMKFIIQPMQESAKGIGKKVKEMDPS